MTMPWMIPKHRIPRPAPMKKTQSARLTRW